MRMDWKKRGNAQELITREEAGVPFLSFRALEETGLVKNGFSTRMGGVSEGKWATMNLSFTKGDDPARVRQNYDRMAEALRVHVENMVLSYQTHTTNVRQVTAEDAGKGVVRGRDYRDVDGLVTDIPGITLVTFYADCVPLYLLDPVHRAIGLSHSGWRGTVSRMGRSTVVKMAEAYGSRPGDLIACIGPSICRDCYEVGEEVASEFTKAFGEACAEVLMDRKENGKYQLDLWKANEFVLAEAGVKPSNIHVTDICTHCNPELLFSHRSAGDERGNLAAFLCLR